MSMKQPVAASAGPLLDITLAHRTAFVANALGPPPQFFIDRVKEEGRIIGALAGKAVHAQRHVQAGVDIIIAQGSEAGGHTGEIGTMVLVPEVVDAVAPVPVLAWAPPPLDPSKFSGLIERVWTSLSCAMSYECTSTSPVRRIPAGT